MEKKTSAMTVTGFVLGIIGLLLSAVPIINNFALVLAVLGLIFGGVGLAKTKKAHSKGGKLAVTAVIISVIAIVIVFVSQSIYSAALNEASKSLDKSSKAAQDSIDKMSGDATQELLKTDVSVKLGQFTATADQYGLVTTELPVTVTNKNAAEKSYDVQVEAVDASGNRIDDDYAYANSLGAGQTQTFKIFQAVTSDKVDALKTATFKIVKVSQS
jgi:hypothetical protein